jgi:hypothetical protein
MDDMPRSITYRGRSWKYSYAWSGAMKSLHVYESVEKPYEALLVNQDRKVILTFEHINKEPVENSGAISRRARR